MLKLNNEEQATNVISAQSPQLLISSWKKKQGSNDSIELFSSELLLRGKIQKVLALKW